MDNFQLFSLSPSLSLLKNINLQIKKKKKKNVELSKPLKKGRKNVKCHVECENCHSCSIENVTKLILIPMFKI